jgi:hypothetical protein
MQVLIQRSQRELLAGIVFSLWVKFQFTAPEEKLLNQYKMRRAVITQSNVWLDLKKAMLYSGLFLLLVGIGVSIPRIYNFGPVGLVFLLNILVLLAMAPFPILTAILYFRIRERLTVSDMLKGRSFSCKNINNLLEKEHFLTQTAEKMRQFLYRTETWNKQVVLMVEPDQPAAVVEMPHAAE